VYCILAASRHFELSFEPVAKVVAMLAARRLPKFIGTAVYFLIVIRLVFLCQSRPGS